MAILVHRQALPYIRRQPGWQTAIMVQHRRTVRAPSQLHRIYGHAGAH